MQLAPPWVVNAQLANRGQAPANGVRGNNSSVVAICLVIVLRTGEWGPLTAL